MCNSGNREHFDLTLKGQLYIGQSNWRLAQLIIAAVRALVFWNLIDIAFQTKKKPQKPSINISGVFNFLSFTVTDIWKLIYYTIFPEHQVDVKRQCHSSPN